LPAEWLSQSSDLSGRLGNALESGLNWLAQPPRLRRLRQLSLALCALWAVASLARLAWSFLPSSTGPLPPAEQVINPVAAAAAPESRQQVDIERMVAWHLFGEVGAEAPPAETVDPAVLEEASGREGIEKGARETRLDLKLRGVVASTEDGLGHAIIEHQKQQAVYTLEDKLPVSGRVVLAKVMARQVVLDNGGTYELLTLFEDSELDDQLPAAPEPRAEAPARELDKREEEDTSALARSYRERLYSDPQSLAEVVSVNAVRENGELLGYRVSPGSKQEQFEQLGFRQGDLVTGINGIALNDPANTMRLYQTMRTATEAVFELQREGEPLVISVNLEEPAP
jgi:general secretion pathway protein C